MNSNKGTAIFVGSLFLIAMITSLIGGSLIESILSASDYFSSVSANSNMVTIGAFLELINGIAVIGIAVSMFPILKRYNESAAFGYVSFRIIEALFCIANAIIPMSIIILNREYLKAGISATTYFQVIGSFLIAIRTYMAELFIPLFFSLGAFLFYYLLYRSLLLPRFISVWGFIGAILVFALCFFKAGLIINIIFVLPIILNEIFLGIWLIFKGINATAIASSSV